MLDLGQFLKAKRESAGLSQKTLGNISGVSDTTIHNIEIGKTKNPGWDLLCQIAKALEFHPFEIMKAAGYITEDDINPAFLMKGLDKLNKNERESVQLFIDFILSRRGTDEMRKEDCNHAISVR